jgi:hypothetical protein
MAIFLACGLLIILGWGSVTAMMIAAARIGLGTLFLEAAQPISLQEKEVEASSLQARAT